MKKSLMSALAITLLVSSLGVSSAFASGVNKLDTEGGGITISQEAINGLKIEPRTEVMPINQNDFNYISTSGKVTEILKNDKYITLTIEDNDSISRINISKDTYIFDTKTKNIIEASKIEKNTYVEGFYKDNSPMIMIYPPTYTPEVLVVKNAEVPFVKLSKFTNLLSSDEFMKLNIGDKTEIVDLKGNKLSEKDINNKHLLVFYDILTRSIPAQTTPYKIVVINEGSDVTKLKEIESLIAGKTYIKKQVKMLPLRTVAEALGYQVKWDSKIQTAYLTKNDDKYTISLGTKKYGKSLMTEDGMVKIDSVFEVEPEIKNGTTFVPESILEDLIN